MNKKLLTRIFSGIEQCDEILPTVQKTLDACRVEILCLEAELAKIKRLKHNNPKMSHLDAIDQVAAQEQVINLQSAKIKALESKLEYVPMSDEDRDAVFYQSCKTTGSCGGGIGVAFIENAVIKRAGLRIKGKE